MANYLSDSPDTPPTPAEERHVKDLSRAGKRLMGFCRTNLFKRLESSGAAFLQSVERHVLRNYVFLHALRSGLPLPIGTQDAALLDPRFTDADADAGQAAFADPDGEREQTHTAERFEQRAAKVYARYHADYRGRFRWLPSYLFSVDSLERQLEADSAALLGILRAHGTWNAVYDAKLRALHTLLTETFPDRKVLVFSQFADTVRYLEAQLGRMRVAAMAGVTGDADDPTEFARRFSPVSNGSPLEDAPGQELRVLIATDVLSEGQNLQDCSIVVNYDLPWAIIRLIQRAGRVDRIGQNAQEILCHSFLPAEGVERIITLRKRVRERLKENAEVVGADEAFFEDEADHRTILNLYHERAGILDGDADGEVDLASHALQIWKNAIDRDPGLEHTVAALPDVAFSSRAHEPTESRPEGVLLFMRTQDGNDALAYVGGDGASITESPLEILSAAQCLSDTPAQPRHERHHQLVAAGVKHVAAEEKRVGGQLGRPTGARFRTYTRLKAYADSVKGQLFDVPELHRALDDIYRYPLRQSAADALNRQLRSGIDDAALAELVIAFRDDDRLCLTGEDDAETREPRIICSLGLHRAAPQAPAD